MYAWIDRLLPDVHILRPVPKYIHSVAGISILPLTDNALVGNCTPIPNLARVEMKFNHVLPICIIDDVQTNAISHNAIELLRYVYPVISANLPMNILLLHIAYSPAHIHIATLLFHVLFDHKLSSHMEVLYFPVSIFCIQ